MKSKNLWKLEGMAFCADLPSNEEALRSQFGDYLCNLPDSDDVVDIVRLMAEIKLNNVLRDFEIIEWYKEKPVSEGEYNLSELQSQRHAAVQMLRLLMKFDSKQILDLNSDSLLKAADMSIDIQSIENLKKDAPGYIDTYIKALDNQITLVREHQATLDKVHLLKTKLNSSKGIKKASDGDTAKNAQPNEQKWLEIERMINEKLLFYRGVFAATNRTLIRDSFIYNSLVNQVLAFLKSNGNLPTVNEVPIDYHAMNNQELIIYGFAVIKRELEVAYNEYNLHLLFLPKNSLIQTFIKSIFPGFKKESEVISKFNISTYHRSATERTYYQLMASAKSL